MTDRKLTSSLQRFSLCVFKRVETFENLSNVLSEWTKGKIQKSLVEALNRCAKQVRKNKPFLDLEMIQKQYSSSLIRRSSETKLVLKLTLCKNHCFVSSITSPINKMFMALINLKKFPSQNNC